ncbi:hypothetical protein [Thalassotalea sp. G2M2-11]|nr:hypothetical protein [Thalassotalea sp. G2M2-11]
MTFTYIIKQLIHQWIKAMAKSQMAQQLVAQETPNIALTEQANNCASCCK